LAHLFQHNAELQFNPPLQKGAKVTFATSPVPLVRLGYNTPVEITTASAFRQGPKPVPLKTIVVMAHLDTGASISSLDQNLAQHLQLITTGVGTVNTAGGPRITNNYAIDLSFVNTQLKRIQNLHIGSCQLNFQFSKHKKNPNDPSNFGFLIGRDIMALWQVVWHGPSSTILISD